MARILVVEDNRDISDIIQDWLCMDNHEVHQTMNGRIGIDMALQLSPHLVLMDMHMPVMGGKQAVHILRTQYGYRGKIVAVTASVEMMSINRTCDYGCNGFISKPIGDDFLDKIARFLEED